MANHDDDPDNLLGRFKLSLQTLFNQDKGPLEKVVDVVKLWDLNKPLQPTSSGRNEPTASGYLFLDKVDFANSRIFDIKTSTQLKRNDVKYSSLVPLAWAKTSDKTLDPTNMVGYLSGDGLVLEHPLRPELRINKFNSQITLDRSKLFNIKPEEDYLKNLFTVRPFLVSSVLNVLTQGYITQPINKFQMGSDGKFYYVRDIPSLQFDPTSELLKDESLFKKYYVYKLEVYEFEKDAREALLDVNKKIIIKDVLTYTI